MSKLWTLEEGLEVVRQLQPGIRALDYHLTLGGGVLNKGKSEKDLDLFIIPLNGHESNPPVITTYLTTVFGHFGDPIRDHPDYEAGDPWHCREALKYRYNGKRIDVFIQ